MADLSPWYSARDELFTAVRDDLQGVDTQPINTPPLDRMIVGILFPKTSFGENSSDGRHSEDTPESVGTSPLWKSTSMESGDDAAEADAVLSTSSRPSSIGLTVAVAASDVESGLSRQLKVDYRATRYALNHENRDSKQEEWTPETVRSVEPIVIDLADEKYFGKLQRIDVAGAEGALSVAVIVRRPVENRVRVTVSLVNEQEKPANEKADSYCWFRPELALSLAEGTFIDGRPARELKNRDSELQALVFLYRHEHILAQGHGCSPTWDDEGEVRTISSTFFPTYEVRQASAEVVDGPNQRFGSYDLRMSTVATRDGLGELKKLADAYEAWIQDKRDVLAEEFRQDDALEQSQFVIGQGNLDSAVSCLKRIREGIDLLEKSPEGEVWIAFRLMNLAMIRNRIAASRDKTANYRGIVEADFEASDSRWRPFQIAFILMNLSGLTNRSHPDRKVADLLWFPTGGGKTEAYLGCIAFSILFRRIVNPHDGGVSAIMRYTLRMLTTDQYGRAASLICALEMIRRDFLPESKVPVSLGLWVGGSTSPNKIEEVKKELAEINSGKKDGDESNLYHVRQCPNCLAKLEIKNLTVVDDSLRITCTTPTCEFRDGLPLYFVDDDVYAKRPSLVIGTVDKFAQMAWQSKVSQLLSTDKKYSAPEMIIQDELHLISGPLGTMVALYETALDLAITHTSGVGPKVIASTATIRRADAQVKAIFDREACQFPPAGIDPSDNYFSTLAPKETIGTRRYVGTIAPSTSQMTLLVRLYAVLLQQAFEMDAEPEVKDTYWTLMGYFNSLRVLGSAYLQAVSDVPDRVKLLAQRRGVEPRPGINEAPLELTSRVTAGQILKMRDALGQEKFDEDETPNLVLATNMISVGLDIPRLGLMVVSGQPQNTSEYIQATSRVGRRYPGLVFVAFNATRTRDVSHFESFEPFHRSLYRAVEATTATPFAARARERGAHGVLVSAARLMFDSLRGADSAEAIVECEDDVRERIIRKIVDRTQSITSFDRSGAAELTSEAKGMKRRLEALLDAWLEAAESGELKKYGRMRQPGAYASRSTEEDALLIQAGTSEDARSFEVDTPWTTITSLRDVDAETSLYEKVFFNQTGEERK